MNRRACLWNAWRTSQRVKWIYRDRITIEYMYHALQRSCSMRPNLGSESRNAPTKQSVWAAACGVRKRIVNVSYALYVYGFACCRACTSQANDETKIPYRMDVAAKTATLCSRCPATSFSSEKGNSSPTHNTNTITLIHSCHGWIWNIQRWKFAKGCREFRVAQHSKESNIVMRIKSYPIVAQVICLK